MKHICRCGNSVMWKVIFYDGNLDYMCMSCLVKFMEYKNIDNYCKIDVIIHRDREMSDGEEFYK
jgi:hypothetical protein